MNPKLHRPSQVPFRDGGFTLVEVIVTMTILGFLLVVVYGVFGLGRSAWERGDGIREKYQKFRIISQMVLRQIKSTVPLKVKSEKAEGDFLAFAGTSQSLKFVSALSLKTGRPEGFIYTIYQFQEGGAEGGKLVVYERRALNKNFMEEEPKEESGVALLEDLSSVRFEYYREEDPNKNREAGWVEEWNAKEENELPKALRITIQKNKNRENADEGRLTIFASLPSNRYEEIRTGATRRVIPQVPGRTG